MFFFEEEEEKKEEKKGPVAPSCYGCLHLLASPCMNCYHPNSIKILWDPIRNKSYRLPSIALCMEHGGVCKFYEPSPERGAEYSILEQYKKITKEKVNPESLEDRANSIIEELRKEGILGDILDKIAQILRDDLDAEEVEEEDEE